MCCCDMIGKQFKQGPFKGLQGKDDTKNYICKSQVVNRDYIAHVPNGQVYRIDLD